MKKKVYIIDDDQDFLDIVAYILKKNYRTLTSTFLDTSQITDFGPDLILMDNAVGMDMSEMMIRRIQAAIPSFSVPVILVTAHHDVHRLTNIKGIRGFIRKPSSIDYIRSYVDRFFSSENDAVILN
jgi:response regulator RpfG family c-di-GMP phosphodiesterase